MTEPVLGDSEAQWTHEQIRRSLVSVTKRYVASGGGLSAFEHEAYLVADASRSTLFPDPLDAPEQGEGDVVAFAREGQR